MMNRDSYFDSLSAIRDEIAVRLSLAKAELSWPDYFSDSFNSFVSGVPYGTQKREAAEISSLKGKPTRKWAHAVVDRCASGRYELTFYIA